MQFDRDRFKALVHYIIWKVDDHAKLGATKLNKALWFSDARAYMQFGRPLTGATYIREKYGPVPKLIMPVRSEMVDEGTISIRRDQLYSYDKDVFTSKRTPGAIPFNQEERRIVDSVIDMVCERNTAASISEETHDITWELAKMGEVIPLHAIFATRIKEPDDATMDWASSEAKRLGLA